ncbi:acyl-CoA synthetase (AMP-forming)/AMP-acid ligase II [Geomicrobium halophilum]|uniref:Acyl-CoA synthetase (AMP-forming)/AMP-acid ligase II n=1 Tax=Geomicrobium halophilum TaxID=549000 RepID=A0A841PWX9_9BACL|nr:long-chain-fatty-acid--CoA ligase [Geomicrobium halophilum]MBB6448552.1 acyl-CoA synthetase (AMP-forming)/AMP-acid ligase II [Geomicrobium halophilum]
MNVISVFVQNVRRHPEKMALIYNEREYTYRGLNQRINQFANGLMKQGVRKGEKVALMMKNSDDFVISFYGAAKLGAVLVPINFRLVVSEVQYILQQSDAVTVICDDEFETLIEEATASIPGIRDVISVPAAKVTKHLSFKNIFHDSDMEPDVKVSSDDDFEILYTSGTTGRPKGALFDHQRISYISQGVTGLLGLHANETHLHVAPLFHSAQLNLFLLQGLYVGATHVILRDFEPQTVLKMIEKYRVTFFFGIPTMYSYLLQAPNADKYNLDSIKLCGYGAAPMAPEIVRQSMELFNTDQFYNLCGLTEGGPSGIALFPEDHKKHIGKSGRLPMLFVECKVESEGVESADGEVGELLLRGNPIMKEYYKKPDETAATIVDGWLHTGDLAVRDEEGYITLVDRSKDMIISGGENVYTVEVENVLYGHPKILEAGVIGTPDDKWGEVVTAVAVIKPGEGTLDLEELQTFCREKMAGFKIPRKLQLVEELPRNASGKLQKYKMREALKNTYNPHL